MTESTPNMRRLVLSVTVEDANGQEVEHPAVKVQTRDLVAYELLARRRGYPTDLESSPVLTMTGYAWAALRRVGGERDFDKFAESIVWIDKADGENVDPTQPEAGNGSV